jgi:hypothetical protein
MQRLSIQWSIELPKSMGNLMAVTKHFKDGNGCSKAHEMTIMGFWKEKPIQSRESFSS